MNITEQQKNTIEIANIFASRNGEDTYNICYINNMWQCDLPVSIKSLEQLNDDNLKVSAKEYMQKVSATKDAEEKMAAIGVDIVNVSLVSYPVPPAELSMRQFGSDEEDRRLLALISGDFELLEKGSASGKKHPDGGSWGNIQDEGNLKATLRRTQYNLLLDFDLDHDNFIKLFLKKRDKYSTPVIVD